MASEEPLFDPSLKKKKKKKQVAFSEDPLAAELDPTTPAHPADISTNGDVDLGPTTVHEQMKQNGSSRENGEDAVDAKEEDDFKAMASDLKKKKKKKDISADLIEDGSGTTTPVTNQADAIPAAEDLDFSELKKKKKSTKKKAAADLEAFEKELGEADAKEEEEEEGDTFDALDDEDLGDDPFARVPEGSTIDPGSEPWLGSDRDYTYPELLHRFYNLLHAANPAMLTASGKRYTIPPPNLMREGNKKSIFINITEICKRMRRSPEHVIQFLFSEMGTTGSVDGSGRLVIKGRFQQKQIENILRRYIVEFVTCKTCKSPDTKLEKENRIFFTTCESCGSRRSVSTIKSGFQAQVGRRSKLKNKTG